MDSLRARAREIWREPGHPPLGPATFSWAIAPAIGGVAAVLAATIGGAMSFRSWLPKLRHLFGEIPDRAAARCS